jgi:hypothetical protein
VPDETLFELIRVFLPPYLSPTNGQKLFDALKQFPDNKDFYYQNPPPELLQGDGWRGLVVLNFDTAEKKTVSGVIMSNSCDIDVRNPRALEVRILFAPLLRIATYEKMLTDSGRSAEQIAATLSDVRKQRVTNIFYLPELPRQIEESIIVLDDVHAHPVKDFATMKEKSRLFSLNMYAFYLFIMKLSIHLCRFQEGTERDYGS